MGAEQVAEEVAAIIRRVGKREDIEEQVANNINLSALATELLAVEGPVRDAAIKLLTNFFRDFEIEEGSDFESEIIDHLDTEPLIKSLSSDPAFQAVLLKAIKEVINSATENESFQETVDEAFGLNNSEKLLETIGEKAKEELAATLVSKITESIKELRVNEMDDDTVDEIRRGILSEERINRCINDNGEAALALVLKVVTTVLESIDETNEDFARLVFQSTALQGAVDTAIDRLIRSGKIDSLVEKAAEAMLRDESSPLRDQIQGAISEKLVERIAESLVSRILPAQ